LIVRTPFEAQFSVGKMALLISPSFGGVWESRHLVHGRYSVRCFPAPDPWVWGPSQLNSSTVSRNSN
jgi:hypothetical protein